MGTSYFEYFAEIIKAVGDSKTGLAALMALIVGVVALVFFRGKHVHTGVKLFVFVLLFGGFTLFTYKFYEVTPSTGDISAADGLASASATPGPVSEASDLSVDNSQSLAIDSMMDESPSHPEIDPLPLEEGHLGAETAALQVVPPQRTKVDCGQYWTSWIPLGKSIGNPCPSECERGQEIGKSVRMANFPPKPLVKYRFQCWKWELR